jgi:creatinine amidohydrolase
MNGLDHDRQFDRVRAELLRPGQLREAVQVSPIAYVPLGTIEWHCEHLPVGLDSLTASGICLRAALATGGVVLPTLYYGTGGDHGRYPWTIMMPGADPLETMLALTISRLRDFGIATVVLFSGHFAGPQVDLVKRLALECTDEWFSVLGYAVNEIEGLPLAPDHAGIFETTLLAELHPGLVDISELQPMNDGPMPESDSWSPTRHDPGHPLYGIIGPDPRVYDPLTAPALVEKSVNWLAAKVREVRSNA